MQATKSEFGKKSPKGCKKRHPRRLPYADAKERLFASRSEILDMPELHPQSQSEQCRFTKAMIFAHPDSPTSVPSRCLVRRRISGWTNSSPISAPPMGRSSGGAVDPEGDVDFLSCQASEFFTAVTGDVTFGRPAGPQIAGWICQFATIPISWD